MNVIKSFFSATGALAAAVACLFPILIYAAEFSADLHISAPQADFLYKLSVMDTHYRLEKIKGPMTVPPFPTIVDRATGVTRGLNPQMKQYMEERDPVKTMMMSPIAGWAYMRKDLEKTLAGTKKVQGYTCRVIEFREPGKSTVAARVWFAQKLDFMIKEVTYGLNANPVMELKNIKEGPVDGALFRIPPGYTKAGESKTAPVTAASKSPAAASTTPAFGNIIFILDASGSMWGQVEGTAKIAIAKEVLTGLIRDLPEDALVGLVTYGHRRKGDCDDVEELIALGPLDKKKMTARIQALSPKGKTPISRSVRLTAERIKHLEDETTIILISDGKETCDPDPCGLVKELKAAGIKFVMHVIGFDVTEEEREQLECMAKAGGGKYYTAGNAGEFFAAAREVVEAPAFTGGYLKITSLKKGRPFEARVDVYRQSDNKSMGSNNTWYRQKPAEYKLAPGVYYLKVTDRSVTPKQKQEIRDIEIVSGQTVGKTLSFGGAGILRIKTMKEGQPFDARADVYRQSDNKRMGDKNTWYRKKSAEFKLVPGIYRISVLDRSVTPHQRQDARDIEVVSGQTVEKTLSFVAGGTLFIKTVKEGQPFDARADVYRQSDNKRMGDKNTWYRKKPAEFKLVPGIYQVTVLDRSVTPAQKQEIRDVEIVSGQTVEKTLSFGGAGILRIKTMKEGQPFDARADVYRQSDNKRMGDKNTWYRKKSAEFKLVPGIYRISVLDRSVTPHQRQDARDIEVVSGQTVEKTLSFVAGGTLFIKTVKEGQPFDARADVYRQSDNKRMGDKNTWYRKKPAEFKLVPGIYQVTVLDRSVTPAQKQEIRDVEIVSGQTVEKELLFVAGGTLFIKTVKDGQPFDARVDVYRQNDNKRMGDKNTWYRKKPAEFKLVPGIYYIKIYDRKTKEKKEVRDIEIISSRTVEKTVAF
ncbi:MAG: VWA domain-containing protein [Thermodesulfobacteriota bacterium]|nr:VWA domain-containing protein [Thermodesulfobacteriota bacterium]